MNHSTPRGILSPLAAAVLAMLLVIPSTGCLHMLLASGIYLWQGGNVVPADCKALEGKRVVVVCRAPASSEYKHAGAPRAITREVSRLLRENVPKASVVDPREVDEWIDENDTDDFKDLGRALKADCVVVIELEHFDLFKGQTLYQGDAIVTVVVYDMEQKGQIVWENEVGQVLFPANSAIPAADKPVQQFESEFVKVLAQRVAVYFYKHDPHYAFAQDAWANR